MKDKKNTLQNESIKFRFLTSTLYPKTLVKSNRFVCYNDKKQPYNAITKKRADVTDSKNHCDYETACNSVKNTPYLTGIGFVLGYDDFHACNYCGLDIDNCINEQGQISEQAQEIIRTLNTYTEISKSGRGIHCIFIATKQGNVCKNNNLNFCKCLELYDKGRYFALTGNIIGNKDIEPRQKECNAIYDKYFKHKELATETNPIEHKTFKGSNNKTYGADYLNYILQKDSKFRNLWGRSITVKDESATDQSFISKLAYWLDYKPELIKEWFYNSPYYQSKDDAHKKKAHRADYIDRSINNALKYNRKRGQ